jgi:hypothetical protein
MDGALNAGDPDGEAHLCPVRCCNRRPLGHAFAAKSRGRQRDGKVFTDQPMAARKRGVSDKTAGRDGRRDCTLASAWIASEPYETAAPPTALRDLARSPNSGPWRG